MPASTDPPRALSPLPPAAPDAPMPAASAEAPAAIRQRTSRWMHRTAHPRKAAESKSRLVGPQGKTSAAVSAGPAKAPAVPPAAMTPNRRLACSVVKMSAMKLQNTETMKRLKTLVQMKKARATQAPVSSDLKRAKNSSRFPIKKAYTEGRNSLGAKHRDT